LEDDLRIGLRSALLSEGLFYEIQMEDDLLGKAVYLDLKHFTQERLDVLDRKGPNALAMTRLTLIPVDRLAINANRIVSAGNDPTDIDTGGSTLGRESRKTQPKPVCSCQRKAFDPPS